MAYQTVLVFTLGCGTHMATLDRSTGKFFVTARKVMVDATCREYAINMSNKRHWSDGIHLCAGLPRGIMGAARGDFNMRWIASLVADTPIASWCAAASISTLRTTRKGYEQGRLRLVYEAFPIA